MIGVRSRVTTSLVAGGVLCLSLAGCGSDEAGIDPDCDAAAVEQEIGHIVEESTLTFKGLRSLACSGDWSYAVAIVDGGGDTGSASAAMSPFLFLKTDDILVLKSPQIVCGADASGEGASPATGQVPADLAAIACP